MRVSLQEIHKSFGQVDVVKGLNLDIADGEFLVLLGPFRLRQDHGLAHGGRAGKACLFDPESGDRVRA